MIGLAERFGHFTADGPVNNGAWRRADGPDGTAPAAPAPAQRPAPVGVDMLTCSLHLPSADTGTDRRPSDTDVPGLSSRHICVLCTLAVAFVLEMKDGQMNER